MAVSNVKQRSYFVKAVAIVVLVVVAIGLGIAVVYKRLSPSTGTPKESFTTFGSCTCPPGESDKPEIINIRSASEYRRIKDKDTYDNQHCNPSAGCAQGHTITYRYIE